MTEVELVDADEFEQCEMESLEKFSTLLSELKSKYDTYAVSLESDKKQAASSKSAKDWKAPKRALVDTSSASSGTSSPSISSSSTSN